VIVPEVPELEVGRPREVALENACRKALAVARGAPDSPVLGVDTVVALGGRIYGKPGDEREARATLRALAGRRHEVTGGLCLARAGGLRTAAATTVVQFRALDQPLIDAYISTGEWRGRAGGYAIQARGAALVKAIEGDYLNVVGLPVATLLELAPELLG
jgi:septum formation protein